MIRYISIILLLAISSGLYAQKPTIIPSKPNTYKQDSIKIHRLLNTNKQDSVKKPRILKEWTLSDDYSEEVNIPIDTVFSLSDRFKITDKYSPVNASLGNYGLPIYQLSFFDRITDPDKFLYSYYYPFMYLPSNPVFTNTLDVQTNLGALEVASSTLKNRNLLLVQRYTLSSDHVVKNDSTSHKRAGFFG